MQTTNTHSLELIPLPHALLSAEGIDVAKFLQGQVTCDVRDLFARELEKSGPCLLGAQCNNKGRVLMVFTTFQPAADQIILQIDQEIIDSSISLLGKYAVFFKVKLRSLSSEFTGFALKGAKAKIVLENLFGQAPESISSWKKINEDYVIRQSENCYLIWLSTQASNFAAQKKFLLDHAQLLTADQWNLELIEQGLPNINKNTQEIFTPQDLNLQLTGGVNFRKGCYTGQEIVARLHYKAKLKRHMYRFEIDASAINADANPTAGNLLRDSSGKHIGEVIQSAQRDAKSIELLASVNDDSIADAFVEGNPQKLRQLPLPYAIPTESENSSSA